MKTAKKRILYTLAVTLIVVFSATFAILMTLERNDYRNYLQGEYSKCMFDLITDVQNIRVDLGKAAIIGSREQKIASFEEIFRQASLANVNLHSLPLTTETSGATSKFLSQVGDFCYTLSLETSQGNDLSDKDYDTIESLKNESFTLESQLKNASDDINTGRLTWGEIRKNISGIYGGKESEVLAQKFTGIQKQVSEYPALIYDGPFSDNVVQKTPKIMSAKVISEKDAEDVVRKVIGSDKVSKIELNKSQGKTNIPSYSYSVTIKGRSSKQPKVTCEITKNGGKVVYLLDGRSIGQPTINAAKSLSIGTGFLDKMGFKNMASTYILNYENTSTISYIYKQGDVAMYPDQVKIKIALDDGSIIGIETQKYLVSHLDTRKLPSPKVSQSDAKKKIGKKLNITSVRLAVIPTPTNSEAYCYEFSGNYKGDNFKVYINADTGFEERIIQIINTQNGQLTM